MSVLVIKVEETGVSVREGRELCVCRGELAEMERLIISDTAQNISFMSAYVT